ncbi:MAG: hypothetical protein IJL18_00855 [Synergistaceae bacterium]|nr:hypothetical protein [Synergistaceae bacterium]
MAGDEIHFEEDSIALADEVSDSPEILKRSQNCGVDSFLVVILLTYE